MPDGDRRGVLSDRILAAAIVLLGLWIVFAPDALGWRFLRERDLTTAALRILTGFLFLFLGVSFLERIRTRKALGNVHEAMNMLVYGRNYRRDREAIRILLSALRSSDATVREKAWMSLKELTGLDMALDPAVWDSWWAANENRFALKKKRPTDEA